MSQKFTINGNYPTMEFTCEIDRFMFIDSEKDAKTLFEILTKHIPGSTFDELMKLIIPYYADYEKVMQSMETVVTCTYCDEKLTKDDLICNACRQ